MTRDSGRPTPPATAAPLRTPPRHAPAKGPPAVVAYFPRLSRPARADRAEIRPTRGPTILILVDALAARHLSTYGYERPTSPSLDRLADDGILFSHAVAASCWTRPTVASLMTGTPLREHRVEDRGARLDASFETLAETFRAAGRPTAAFVSNPVVRSEYGYDQGFDTYLDSDDFGLRTPAPGILEQAAPWVRAHARDDFFLWLFLTDAHDPYQPNPGTAGMFTDDPGPYPVQPPPEVRRPFDARVQRRIVGAYDESVRYAFDEIGGFVDLLRELGIYERATIAISADHGEMLGEHRAWRHLYQMWEPVLRIPLVVRSPAIATDVRGTVDTRLVRQVDLMPTLLDLGGLRVPPGVRGQSLVPMLRDPAVRPNATAVSEFALFGVHRRAVRDDRYKVVEYHAVDAERFRRATGNSPDRIPRLPVKGVRVEMYDLERDPDETRDLATRGLPENGRRLLEGAGPLTESPGESARDDELLRDLRALGYAN